MKKSRHQRHHLGVFVPGLRGGVDEAARYLFETDDFQYLTPHIFRTKGLIASLAPARFAFVLLNIFLWRLFGRLDAAHVNVSVRGSTLRKSILTGLLRLLRVPYSVQIHSGRYPKYWAGLAPWARRLIGPMFTKAECVLVLGRDFEQFAVDTLGVDHGRVIVMPNSVPVPPKIVCEPVEVPRIAYVGRLNDNKGYLRLLIALRSLQDTHWTAEFVGDGEIEEARRTVAAWGMVDRVRIRSWADQQQIAALMACSDIFVLPSKSEGLALSLLEAMSNGLACIATPVGAHRDVMLNEIHGLMVDPNDVEELGKAIRRLVESAQLRAELGAAARKQVHTEFSVEQLRRRYDTYYTELFFSTSQVDGLPNAY